MPEQTLLATCICLQLLLGKLTLNQLPLSTLRVPIPTKQQLRRLRTLIQHNAALSLDHGRQPPPSSISAVALGSFVI